MAQAGIERSPEEKTPSITVRAGGRDRVLVLDHVPFTIGRKSDRDLVFDDPGISREHAVIQWEDGRFYLSDNGSRRGTFVNGERHAHVMLTPGDRVTFGAPEPEVIFEEQAPEYRAQPLLRKLTSSDDVSEIGKLMLFLQAARALDVSRVESDVLATLLEYAIKLVGAERGFIYLREGDGSIHCSCGRDNRGNILGEQSDISRSTIDDAFKSGADFIMGDTSKMSMVEARFSIIDHDLRTIVAIPLRSSSPGPQAESGVFGLLYLDSRLVSHNLSTVSHSILRAIAAEAAALAENARLLKVEHAAASYRRELEIATAIQQSLISVAAPSLRNWAIRARTIPCTEVGGDFYDFLTPPGELVAVLADISGKGIAAAILASNIQGMLYSQLSAGVTLAEAARTVNSFLCSRVSGIKYATLILARMSDTGQLELLNCGHVPPILVDGEMAHILEHGNVPVGLFSDATFEAVTLDFPARAKLVLYSDGLTEAENSEGDEFGQSRLLECLHCPEPLDRLFSKVNAFIGERPAQDDRTAIVVERR